MLTITWLAFWGLLRPGEVCALERGDLLMPTAGATKSLLLRIRRPKRRASGARQIYTRIDEEDCRGVCLHVLDSLRPGEKLWPASQTSLSLRLRRGLRELVPLPHRFSLGSLRAGGSTALFERWHEDVQRLQWRGRWREMNTLIHYVQALEATLISLHQNAATRERIDRLAQHCVSILLELLEEVLREAV